MYRQKLVHDVCQYRNVPLATAIALVRAADPVPYWKQNIERQYRPSAQVRGTYYTEWMILMLMARTLEECIDLNG
jgi:hypothetical protein